MSGATNNTDGSKKKWLHGKAVVNGELRFLSVSALEKADASKSNGCLRRWWYQYIKGIKEEQSDQMVKGEKLHAEIAHYLTTGKKVLSSQVMAGMHMIPEPGSDLLVEHDIVPQMPDGKSGLKRAVLKASEIPIVGAIDLIHARGVNKGGMDIEETYDPKNTIEVIDWKSCRTLSHIKSGPDLLKTIQMVGYGKYIFDAEPEVELVRLSHGYFPSQGSPRKTTIRATREQIEKSWEHSNRVASSIRDAAKEINPDLVEANTNACRAYGKECPAIKECSAVKNNVMAKFVGNILSSQIIPPGNLTKKMETPPNNSILAQIKAKQQGTATPAPTKGSMFGTVGVSVTLPSQPKSTSDEKSEIERLKAELKAREEAWKVKDELPLMPDISNGPELVPSDVPESDPSLASKPQVDAGFNEIMAQAFAATPEQLGQAAVEAEAPKKKRGPKGPRKKPEAVEIKVNPEPTPVVNPEPTPIVVNPEPTPVVVNPGPVISGPINLYVDCTIDGLETESIWPLIDHLCNLLNQEAKVTDFRIAKELDFGKWKGALAAFIRATPIPAGNYTLTHAHSDIGQVAVETLRGIVRQSGGVMIMGMK